MMELELLEHALVRGNGEDYLLLRMLWKKRTDSANHVVESKMILFVFSWNSELPRFFFSRNGGSPASASIDTYCCLYLNKISLTRVFRTP
jgi:hypothetical protein